MAKPKSKRKKSKKNQTVAITAGDYAKVMEAFNDNMEDDESFHGSKDDVLDIIEQVGASGMNAVISEMLVYHNSAPDGTKAEGEDEDPPENEPVEAVEEQEPPVDPTEPVVELAPSTDEDELDAIEAQLDAEDDPTPTDAEGQPVEDNDDSEPTDDPPWTEDDQASLDEQLPAEPDDWDIGDEPVEGYPCDDDDEIDLDLPLFAILDQQRHLEEAVLHEEQLEARRIATAVNNIQTIVDAVEKMGIEADVVFIDQQYAKAKKRKKGKKKKPELRTRHLALFHPELYREYGAGIGLVNHKKRTIFCFDPEMEEDRKVLSAVYEWFTNPDAELSDDEGLVDTPEKIAKYKVLVPTEDAPRDYVMSTLMERITDSDGDIEAYTQGVELALERGFGTLAGQELEAQGWTWEDDTLVPPLPEVEGDEDNDEE